MEEYEIRRAATVVQEIREMCKQDHIHRPIIEYMFLFFFKANKKYINRSKLMAGLLGLRKAKACYILIKFTNLGLLRKTKRNIGPCYYKINEHYWDLIKRELEYANGGSDKAVC